MTSNERQRPGNEQAIRTLPRTEIERLRNWIEDYLEDQLELSEEFKSKIEQGRSDIAEGKVPLGTLNR